MIIGILAAVALPQYKLAVCKTRMTQVETVNRQIYDANKAYILSNAKAAEAFGDLGFVLPGYLKQINNTGQEVFYRDGYSFLLDPGGGVACANGEYRGGSCQAVLYTYITAGHHDPQPGHCISYDDTGYKYCLSRWPESTCRPGAGSQMVCTIKK